MKRLEVIIEATYGCNLRCKYCYNSVTGYKKESLSHERFKKLVNILADENEDIRIVWHGGEPLTLGIPYYEKMLEIEKEIMDIKGVKISNSFQTNGTLIDNDWIAFFKKHNISGIGISFDGINNEKYRQGSDKTLAAIRLMQKHGIKFGCMAVIGDDEYSLIDNYKFFAERGIRMEFSYLSNEGEADGMNPLTPERFSERACELFDYWLHDKGGIEIRLFSAYISIALGGNFRICSNSSCHGSYLSVAPNGDISNCGRIMMQRYKFANIDDISECRDIFSGDGFIEMLRGAVERRRRCKEGCEFFNECCGGCSEQAILEGDITKPPKNACYNFRTIYSHVRDAVNEIIEGRIPLSELNPAVKRLVLKNFSTGEFSEPVTEKYV